MRSKYIVALFSFLFLILVFPSFAQGKQLGIGSRPNMTAQPTHAQGQNGKEKACQAREQSIKNRMTRLTALANKMQTTFSNITSRVENYYTTKDIPAGKTLSNYDALLSAIATKKSAVEESVTTAQTSSTEFDCTTSDPRTQLTTFREQMQTVKAALKDYRTAIKNLVVAVHSVSDEAISITPTVTP